MAIFEYSLFIYDNFASVDSVKFQH